MKTPNINIFIRRSSLSLSIPIFLLLFTACWKVMDTDLKTEIKIKTLTFPPKLAVSATLDVDGEKGDFRILIAEGRAFASYVPYRREIIIRDGEIRLFEDDKLILSEPGPIDMSYIAAGFDMGPKYWYRFSKSGISTRPGSIYRLEVEVEGYETVTSTMTMPATPVVSVSIDTTIMVIKKFDYYEFRGWPVSIYLTDPDPNARNYFALQIHHNNNYYRNSLVGVSDISILQDNPDLEAQQGGLAGTDYEELYLFQTLIMSDLTFMGKGASFSIYSMVESTSSPNIDNPFLIDNPNYEKVKYRHETFLRIQHFSESTFKYYRDQTLQRYNRGDFLTEPITITGNIENGYGLFAVINSVSVPILEYDYLDWRWVGQ